MSHDASEINRLLLDRFEEVCMHLLPNGKRKGNHWMVGNINGDPGESLQITMTGSAAGRYIDFSDKENKGATPLWLWANVRGIKFKEAVNQACEWLGVRPDDYGVKRNRQKQYASPGNDAAVRIAEPNTPVMDYLVVERRLDPVVVSKAKISENPEGDTVIFPYAEYNQEKGHYSVVHRKSMKLARPDGKKDIHSTKGTKRCLFGKQLIDDNTSELVISEGEIDALSWNSWGIPAVSVPNGVSDFEWVSIDWDWLMRFEKIYVSMDMDEPGQEASEVVCKRLGLHRTYIVSLPKKDANECLTAGLTRDDMLECLAKAKAIELDEIKKPDAYLKEVADHYVNDPAQSGWETPWYPELPWRVRPGEFTVLSGHGGHGKTQMLNQLMIGMLSQGLKVMDASFEIRPGLTLYYMTRCAMAKKYAEKEQAEACVNWLNEGMFFLDCIGTVNVTRLFQAMEYARKRHGIDVFVVDSLFKLGINPEDFGSQRELADKMTTFCNNTGAHVILVAHSRKAQNGNEFSVPSKADVAGSSDICNGAFNVLIVWRNKLKKRKLDEARQSNDIEEIEKWMDQPDGKILLDKQRFGEGEESEVHTWFNKDSCQFHTAPNRNFPYFQSK